MARSALDEARRLASAGRHAAVISLLEPKLPLFRDSHSYYYLLGSACLRSGDLGGANSYLRRAEQLEPADIDTRLCVAALQLRRGEAEKAIATYLSILDEKPGHRVATRALSKLRDPGILERVVDAGKPVELEPFLPASRAIPPFLLWSIVVLLAIGAAVLAWPLAASAWTSLAKAASPRGEVAAVNLTAAELRAPVGSVGGARYILTEKEAVAGFERAKALLQEYRDNAARVELNRIVDSNATMELKEKARTLLGFALPPDWRTLKDIPSFAALRADPLLYRECAVIWEGRAANISGSGATREFDFLAGYGDRTRLDGILRVSVSDPAIPVPVDNPFELLAFVEAGGGMPRLRAIAIHELRDTKH
ncbi:MAG: tetratricopeptide repeat protein [Spirochaetota bacterium]